MALIYTDSQNYTDIATAIRGKLGTADTYLPSEMAGAILLIETGGGDTLKQLIDITGNAIDLCALADDISFLNYDTTTNAKTLAGAFYGSSIDEIPNIDTQNCFEFNRMFQECPNLQTASIGNGRINLSKAQLMEAMFSNCTALTSASVYNIPNTCTDLSAMFNECPALTSVYIGGDTSGVTTTSDMFRDDVALQTAPFFITTAVESMEGMFSGCSALTRVPVYDCNSVTVFNQMLHGCISLTAVPLSNIRVSLDISASALYPSTELVNTISRLRTVTTTQTLTMGQTNLNKLTAEQIAVATNKGWTVA